MSSFFKVSCRTTEGETSTALLTGPTGATVERARKVLELVADTYGVDPSTIELKQVEERASKGFLHPIFNVLPDGREARVTGWYL